MCLASPVSSKNKKGTLPPPRSKHGSSANSPPGDSELPRLSIEHMTEGDEERRGRAVPRDYRDNIIQTLADSEASLVSQLAETRTTLTAYKEVLSTALECLHGLSRKFDHLQEAHHRLRDAYRHLREALLRDDERRAA